MTNARRRFIIRTNLQERLVLKCAFPWPSDVAGHLASIDKGTRVSAGRKCPHTASKPLRIHKVFSAGFFLVCEHFCSGRTASHRTALDFRGIFVLLDAGGLSPAKDKRAKSTEKTGCPACVLLLIDAIKKQCGRYLPHCPVLRIIRSARSFWKPCWTSCELRCSCGADPWIPRGQPS